MIIQISDIKYWRFERYLKKHHKCPSGWPFHVSLGKFKCALHGNAVNPCMCGVCTLPVSQKRVPLRSVQVALKPSSFKTEEQAPRVDSSIYIHGSNDEYLQAAERFEAVLKIWRTGMQQEKTLPFQKTCPFTREKTVQYLSALTEKQQWQQSLQLVLRNEYKLRIFFHSSIVN